MAQDEAIAAAVARLKAEGLIGYPTETVWGLGANARSEKALTRLRAWKGRGDDAPISLLIADVESVSRQGFEVVPGVRRLMEAFWPGPLTLVLPSRGGFASGIARDDGAVGLRCSSHPLVERLVAAADVAGVGPLTATSLNRSGRAPARSRGEARQLCADAETDPLLLDAPGADAGGGAPSTVVDCTGEKPRVLRWGAVTPQSLEPMLAV